MNGIMVPDSFQSAEEALYTLHQARTHDELVQSSQRRTRTVPDMQRYWNILQRATSTSTSSMRTIPPSIPLIHITGTKGKGSTACLCESILHKRGYRTGLFTSPHLMTICERIRINGRPIDEKTFGEVYRTLCNCFEEQETIRERIRINGTGPSATVSRNRKWRMGVLQCCRNIFAC